MGASVLRADCRNYQINMKPFQRREFFVEQAADGVSAAWENECARVTVYVEASEVGSGATVSIQAKAPSGTWVTIDELAVTANGAQEPLQFDGPFSQLRAKVSGYQDGKYTVGAEAM